MSLHSWALAGSRAVRDLAYGAGWGELAEEQGDELVPGREVLGSVVRLEFAIHGSWNCGSGPRTYTLDPVIKIQN